MGFASVSLWAERLILVGLLCTAYAAVWTPARGWISESVVAPALAATAEGSATSYRIEPGTRTVRIQNEASGGTHSFRIPGGILFLLPAVILGLSFPRRPYWLFLWLAHAGFAVFFALLLGVGILVTEWAFVLHRLLRGDFFTAVTLGAPLSIFFFFRHERNARD